MKALQRLFRYSVSHRKTIWLASFCSVANKIFDILPEVLIGAAVDIVVNKQNSYVSRFGYTDTFDQLLFLAVVTFVIWVCESLFEYIYSVLWRNLAQTLQHELRLDAYEHIQNLDMAYFEDQSTGGLLSILSDDINQLERFLDGGANALIQVATAVVVVGSIFFYLAPSVAVLAFLPIPIILAGAFKFQERIAPRYLEVRERVSLLAARLANNLSGVATIKSFTSEKYELEQIRSDSQAYRSANRAAIQLSSAFIPLIRMAILGGFIATLLLGGYLTTQGKLPVGAYSVLVFLTQRLLWPLTGLAQTVDLYERAMASANRVLNLINTPILIERHGKSLPLAQVRGHVVFQNVSFSYAQRSSILKGISLEIPAGQTVAVVGATGSGKSTLVKLLLRFYAPQSGQILLDGTSVSEIELTDLRRAIGLVSQDVFLFHGTVRDNIAYGSWNASFEEIIAASKVAEAHEFISELPQGYDTLVGERGIKLSGGQRQRLSIARALLKNPPLLVLDEATSAVDNETEAAIQKSLARIVVNRSTLVIAHRLSTIRQAHRIYVLDNGEVVEMGTHDELILQNGAYASLWNVQTGVTS